MLRSEANGQPILGVFSTRLSATTEHVHTRFDRYDQDDQRSLPLIHPGQRIDDLAATCLLFEALRLGSAETSTTPGSVMALTDDLLPTV